MTDDSIKRSDAIEAARDPSYIAYEIRKKIRLIPSAESAESMPEYIDNILIVRHYCNGMVAMNEECYNRLQKRDEPITTEEAIEHLQECGWLPEHDRILTEPKCGKWEEKETFSADNDDPIIERWQSAKCSECGKYHTTPYMYYFNHYNFCPNCGAKMVNDDER